MVKRILMAVALGTAAFSMSANAAFIQSTSNCNGSASGQTAVTITGCNNGSFTSGYINYLDTASSNGIFAFTWSLSHPDPGWDFFYYVNSSVFYLAGSSSSGSVSTNVAAGSLFGWRITTVDNIVGAPTAKISVKSNPNAVPEPGTLLLLGAGLIALGWGARKRRSQAI